MVQYINPKGYTNIHIGSLPPPNGGISVYLHRLLKLDPNLKILNIKKYHNSFLLLFLKIFILSLNKKNHLILHVPSIKYYLTLYLVNKIFGTKYSLVLHGEGFQTIYESKGRYLKNHLKIFLQNSMFIQIVGRHLLPFVQRIRNNSKNVFVQNAFLPPPLEEKEVILNSYPSELMDFISQKKPLLIANAYSISFINGIDLYGLDMCIDLIKELKEDFNNIGIVFAIANPKINSNYIRDYQRHIKAYGISDNFFFLSINSPIWPLFEQADLMIRPTYSDGYGISIQESIYFNCPAVASDVCERPEGTILFQNRNYDDFSNHVKEILV